MKNTDSILDVYSILSPENDATFDFNSASHAMASGALAKPIGSGRRARRRAKYAAAKSTPLASILAAQGCMVSTSDEALPLSSADDGAEGGNDAGGAGNDAGGGSVGNVGTSSTVANDDTFETAELTALQLEPNEVLGNDVAADGGQLEIVRVFGAENGTVVFDGAVIQFTPDEGFSGAASFQYEVRDSNGALTVATVDVNVGASSHDDSHDSDAHHMHPDDPAMAAEHEALLDLVITTDATHVAVGNGSWFDPATWADGVVPGEDARVHIPEGVVVAYDGESAASLFTVRVDGMLNFATDQNTFMEVDTFVVTPTGHLTIGTLDEPVAEGVEAIIQIADNGPIDTAWDPTLLSRGLLSHGKVDIHGAEKESFLKLAVDPMRGDTSILLEEAPVGWNVGDRLVLTGTKLGDAPQIPETDRVRDVTTEDEELVITSIDGNRIYFADPLEYDHDTPRDDLKAYVANYSRNVQILTENASSVPVSQRGHTMFMHSDDVDIRYAEFFELGRTDKSERAFDLDDLGTIEADSNLKGRYSLHVHRSGFEDLDDPVMVVGNAVWGSPGWGYVHHDANAIFAHNAAYDVFGASFVAESGNEIGRWVSNISIKNEGVGGTELYYNDPKLDAADFDLGRNGTGFWFQGRLVDAVDNVAAGSPGGQGYTYFHRGTDGNHVDPDTLKIPEQLTPAADNYLDEWPAISQFVNNEAIGVGVGLMVIKGLSDQPHDLRSVIEDFTAWDVRVGALNQYTGHYTYINVDLIAAEGEGPFRNLVGLDFSSGTQDMVVIGGTIDGFHTGVSVGSHLGRDTAMRFVDLDVINTFADYRGAGAEYFGLTEWDLVLTAAEAAALGGALSFESDRIQFQEIDTTDGEWPDNFTGTKTDSIGEFAIGGTDYQNYEIADVRAAAGDEGFWTTADGTLITVLERYFQDRGTGEVIKTGDYVALDVNLDVLRSWGFQDNGAFDPDNAAPIGVDDAVVVNAGSRVIIDALSNDTDAEGGALKIDGYGTARNGSVWLNDDGNFVYEADPGFTGTDEFFYFINDDNGAFGKAYVTVTVEV